MTGEWQDPWVMNVSTDPDWGVEQVGDEWKWHVTDGHTTTFGSAASEVAAKQQLAGELEWWRDSPAAGERT